MKTIPLPVRLDQELQKALREGAAPAALIANVELWPRRLVAKAYRRIGTEWDDLETAAMRSQGPPDFKD